MGTLIAGLFVWATLSGVSQPSSHFYITPLSFGLAIASVIIAVLSYVSKPEKSEHFHAGSAIAAYCLLIASISVLIIGTGTLSSPFLALWLIAAIFVGAFGNIALALLFIGVVVYYVMLYTTGSFTAEAFVGLLLVGALPIIISYVLWHENSGKGDSKKERAYYDLAAELNQVSNKSDVVIGAISDGVLAINNQGVIELINPAAQRIVGWGNQDALGLDYKSVLQLLSKDGHEVDKSNDPVFEVLSTNQPVRRDELQLQTNSGKKINVEVVVSPIGRLGSGAIIVFRDITKEQEEERAQAEFISTASHEMRTPVASIEGYLGLALNPATAKIDDKARDFITKAHEAAEHLGRLFQDLLDVTKADDGRLSNNPKVVNVVEFTSTIVEGLQPKASEKGLHIFFKPVTEAAASDEGGLRNVSPVYYVDLDNDHLREVLANLIENAIKYTPKGEVVVDVQGDDAHVVITITDSGIGIPAEDIPHLFQKFYRVDNSDTREIGGTGLGLYLCRRLVETMGGRIWVDSEYKKGSTFSVELPRISHEEANRLIEAADARPTKVAQDVMLSDPATDSDEDPEHVDKEAAKALALSTPIILGREKSVSTPAPAAQPTEETTTTVDPLVGTPAVTATPQTTSEHKNAMVLPSALQDMPSTLQKAAVSAPVPTPVAAPAPTQPTSPPPATTTTPTTPAAAPVASTPTPTQPSAPSPVPTPPAAVSAPTPVQLVVPERK